MENAVYEKITHKEAKQYHEDMRDTLHRFVEQEFAYLSVKLKPITLQHTQTANSWKEVWKEGRAATWDWTEMYYTYQGRHAIRRLDMAVFKNGKLLGLTYGMLDRGRLVLKVHAMEANPSEKVIAGHMLKITLYAAESYAQLNDTPEIWLCDPTSPAHVRLYQSKGYESFYDHWDRCTHLAKRLK
jgi:hypothetical protein